jgi:integrase
MTKTATATPDEPERRVTSVPEITFQPPAAKPRQKAASNPRRASGRKRANGEGTIYSRKDGRYEGAAFVPTTAGTYKRVRVYGRTHDEVRKKLTKLLEQADQGILVASESWTVEQYLTYWLEHVVRVRRQPKTYQGYESVVRRHLIPELGKKRLGKLAARDVRLAVTRIREACQCCRNGWDASRDQPRCCAKTMPECCASRLSVRMVQSVLAVLRNALQTAVRDEVVPRNVARLVTVATPKYRVNRGLTVDQARTVLKGGKDERLYALYVLALCLGLRRGELFGLRWDDLDLETGTLEVVQTLQRVGGELRFVRPKTDDSERSVPLPGICTEALKAHRERQKTERAKAGMEWREHGLVFPSRIGTPMEPDNLRRSWDRIRTAAGLDSVRFHDLRHTCVSLLLDLGVPPHVVREIVGHSDIEVTMTIYAHAALDEKRKALGKLGDALG